MTTTLKEHPLSSMTIAQAVTRYGVDVLDHLDRDATVPILSGLQMQGDVAVIPITTGSATTPVPPEGVAVVRGESGGNTHLLLADGPVMFDQRTASDTDLLLGILDVPEGATAYLAHPEHAYTGIAPGRYEVRRQREQADELRLVAD
jgi:hypothetical protein